MTTRENILRIMAFAEPMNPTLEFERIEGFLSFSE